MKKKLKIFLAVFSFIFLGISLKGARAQMAGQTSLNPGQESSLSPRVTKRGVNNFPAGRAPVASQVATQTGTISVSQQASGEVSLRRQAILQKREAFREAIRNHFANRQQLLEQARETFRLRLEQIKDARKKNIIARIEENLNRLNERIVEQMGLVLDRMENLLDKITGRTNKMADEGLNVYEAKTNIDLVQKDIDQLRVDLASQAGRIYVPQVASESGLRIAAGNSYQQLRDDIKPLHEKLVSIKKEIAALLHLLAQIKGGTK